MNECVVQDLITAGPGKRTSDSRMPLSEGRGALVVDGGVRADDVSKQKDNVFRGEAQLPLHLNIKQAGDLKSGGREMCPEWPQGVRKIK